MIEDKRDRNHFLKLPVNQLIDLVDSLYKENDRLTIERDEAVKRAERQVELNYSGYQRIRGIIQEELIFLKPKRKAVKGIIRRPAKKRK